MDSLKAPADAAGEPDPNADVAHELAAHLDMIHPLESVSSLAPTHGEVHAPDPPPYRPVSLVEPEILYGRYGTQGPGSAGPDEDIAPRDAPPA